MKIKHLYIILLVAFNQAYSQSDDFETWSAFSISTELSERIRLCGESELRLHENSTKINKVYADLGAKFYYSENIDAGLFYRFEEKRNKYNEYNSGHRFYIDLNLKKEYSSFELGLRNRYQTKYANDVQNDWDLMPDNYYRAKFSFTYKIFKSPIKPELSTEIFYRIKTTEPSMITQYRITIGFNYKFNKRNSFDIYYRQQNEINIADPLHSGIIGLCYNLKLK